MPSEDEISFRFNFPVLSGNFQARLFAPLTDYFNFDSFLMIASSCEALPDASSTEDVEQYIPSGFALTLIENGFSTPKKFVIDSSENFMTNFIKKPLAMA